MILLLLGTDLLLFCFYKFSKVYVCDRNKVYIFSKFSKNQLYRMCDTEEGCCKKVKPVRKVQRRLGANQIPDSLINDPILNEMIAATLPSNYNFELHKTIYKIQCIKSTAKRIALQFPEGLLLFATTISELLEKYTGCVCIIMGE